MTKAQFDHITSSIEWAVGMIILMAPGAKGHHIVIGGFLVAIGSIGRILSRRAIRLEQSTTQPN